MDNNKNNNNNNVQPNLEEVIETIKELMKPSLGPADDYTPTSVAQLAAYDHVVLPPAPPSDDLPIDLSWLDLKLNPELDPDHGVNRDWNDAPTCLRPWDEGEPLQMQN
ncbi:hypothetical protein CSOJ01_03378 [Colletotrichum sojae]|uniref:Uncharacterized protein n=1 Tax=Colletotrichum sojae TaxID=2175907 RepID=A0A8H6JMQ4_9PEZI|nr:hypothetical protein CSOJ01_03378 [Colletotrichum sojae]